MNVYVGCALRHATEEFKRDVFAFKDELKKTPNVHVLDFVGLENAEARTVYTHDTMCVETCDAMIAFIDEPSLGLGMELSLAIEHKKPVLCLCTNKNTITRMVLGAGEVGLLTIEEYTTRADALEKTHVFLAR